MNLETFSFSYNFNFIELGEAALSLYCFVHSHRK